MSCCWVCWVSAKDTSSPGILFPVSGRTLAAQMFVVIVTPGEDEGSTHVSLSSCMNVRLSLSSHPSIRSFTDSPLKHSWRIPPCLTLCLILEMQSWKLFRCCLGRDHSLFNHGGNIIEISVYQTLARYVLTMQGEDE